MLEKDERVEDKEVVELDKDDCNSSKWDIENSTLVFEIGSEV